MSDSIAGLAAIIRNQWKEGIYAGGPLCLR
jgi:hypothetical protein